MTKLSTIEHTSVAEETTHDRVALFGFWVYLMTDLVLFASLFAVYAVLRGNGHAPEGLVFSGPFVLTETLILLTSSFVCGLSLLAARTGSVLRTLGFLAAAAVLGIAFVVMEFSEFARLVEGGDSWQRSGALSSYFTLVGTHGLHIVAGLLWVFALMVAISYRGLTRSNTRKLVLWSLFWHFLDIVWIFIFTIVYLFSL